MRGVITLFRFSLRWIALAIALAFAVPALASADLTSNPSKLMVYSTSIQGLVKPSYPLVGQLRIRTSPGGIINGYYQPADQGQFLPVTGGVSGKHVWLDIGNRKPMRVIGNFENGRISGTLYTTDNQMLSFDASNAHEGHGFGF
jgi:hypothetical protein